MLQRFGAQAQRPPPEKKDGKGGGKGKGKGGSNWSWRSGSDAAASGHGEGEGSVWDQNTSRQDGASSSSWTGWNQWSDWGARSWRSKDRASSPHAGQYDHRGTALEDKGMGVYVHDRKMRRYEDKAEGASSRDSSEDSERSDSYEFVHVRTLSIVHVYSGHVYSGFFHI